jgi:hypothetical protein
MLPGAKLEMGNNLVLDSVHQNRPEASALQAATCITTTFACPRR